MAAPDRATQCKGIREETVAPPLLRVAVAPAEQEVIAAEALVVPEERGWRPLLLVQACTARAVAAAVGIRAVVALEETAEAAVAALAAHRPTEALILAAVLVAGGIAIIRGARAAPAS